MLFFIASDFTFTTRHIHNQASFPVWFRLFIPSGAISLLFSSSILDIYRPGEFIFQCHIFLCFLTIHGVLKARMLKWFAIPLSSGPHIFRTLYHDPSVLGDPTRYGSQFHLVRQGCGPGDQIGQFPVIVVFITLIYPKTYYSIHSGDFFLKAQPQILPEVISLLNRSLWRARDCFKRLL